MCLLLLTTQWCQIDYGYQDLKIKLEIKIRTLDESGVYFIKSLGGTIRCARTGRRHGRSCDVQIRPGKISIVRCANTGEDHGRSCDVQGRPGGKIDRAMCNDGWQARSMVRCARTGPRHGRSCEGKSAQETTSFVRYAKTDGRHAPSCDWFAHHGFEPDRIFRCSFHGWRDLCQIAFDYIPQGRSLGLSDTDELAFVYIGFNRPCPLFSIDFG